MAKRLKKRLLYTFGVADLFFTVMVNMEIFFFPAFLTDYAQFSLKTVGNILWITSVLDIFCVLAAGIILQKVTLRFGGKYRSWFLVGPPIVAVLFFLQFTKIGSDLTAAIIVTFGFVASHLIWNVAFSASGSLVGRMSQRPDERTILSTSRAQGFSAAGLIFSFTAMPMILFFSKLTDDITGYSITTGVFSCLMVLGYWYVYMITAGKDPYDEPVTGASQKKVRQPVWQLVVLVFKNPPLLSLILAETFRNTYILTLTAFAFYYFDSVLNNLPFITVFILAISIARLTGTFAATWVGIKIGKRNAYWIFLVLTAVVFVSAKLLGSTAWSFTILFCIASMLGMIAGSMSTVLFSDTVVYGEWKTGVDIRGFTMSLQSLPIKVAVLIRSAILTVGLVVIGYVANTEPTQEVISGISSIMIFAPAAASLIAAVTFYFGYKIEDKQVLQMQAEIDSRKALEPVGA